MSHATRCWSVLVGLFLLVSLAGCGSSSPMTYGFQLHAFLPTGVSPASISQVICELWQSGAPGSKLSIPMQWDAVNGCYGGQHRTTASEITVTVTATASGGARYFVQQNAANYNAATPTLVRLNLLPQATP